MSNFDQEIEKAKERYAQDDLDQESLEDEIEFWLKVKECRYCRNGPGGSLCSSHYGELLGR